MRDYRERQEQARQLWIKRTPLKEIAAAVRSDVPTVKSWIGSVGKRRIVERIEDKSSGED